MNLKCYLNLFPFIFFFLYSKLIKKSDSFKDMKGKDGVHTDNMENRPLSPLLFAQVVQETKRFLKTTISGINKMP